MMFKGSVYKSRKRPPLVWGLTSLALLLLILAGGMLFFKGGKPPLEEELRLTPASFSDLKGWQKDDLTGFAQALSRSCDRILKRPADKPFGVMAQAGTYAAWQPACLALQSIPSGQGADSQDIRSFVEAYFTPYQVSAGAESEGLFTGYYEAYLRGAAVRHGPYQTPLYRRPDDLVMVNLGEFRPHLKGERIAGRVQAGQLKPYESRADIESGAWPHSDHAFVWVDSPVDAFFVQIQGSGIVELADGSTMRIGYAGQNGHPYYAIGRELIARGALTKETVSMQTIRTWLEANPEEAVQVMNTNPSYVFFRQLDGDGPLGGEGVALTAGRSLAVDRTLIPYGAPIWLQAEAPKEGEEPLTRLMVAQDTGGAIRGAVRGDVFWGFGAIAEQRAGHMKSKGRYWILLPKVLGKEYAL